MSTRNFCFARGAVQANVDQVVFSVPADHVLLLKNVLIQNTLNAENSVTVYVRSPSQSVANTVDVTVIKAVWFSNTNYWVALNPGDEVHVSAPAGAVYYWMSGALLPEA